MSNFELDFLSVISIKQGSLIIELNEVSGFVEANALVKRSARSRGTTIQIQYSNRSQLPTHKARDRRGT